ncbi:MAG: tRNA (adenosine(37)-N6)-dimethylallyltransferase MiaA, partial [Minisyncoccia bacterium]
ITRRVDHMIKAGLEEEVKNLSKLYDWKVEPMKGIGYREWREYFEGGQTLGQTKERIVNNCMQLAKKQRTWFKRNNSIHWVSEQAKAVEFVTTFLNK